MISTMHSQYRTPLHRTFHRTLGWWNNSINARIFSRVLLGAAMVALVVAGLQLWSEYLGTKRQSQQELQHVESVVIPRIASALWTVDDDQIQVGIQSLQNIQWVSHIRIKERDSTVFEWGDSTRADVSALVFPLQAAPMGKPVVFGQVELTVTQTGLHEALIFKYLGAFGYSLVLILAISLFTWYVIEQQMTRYLRRLARFVRTRNAHNLHDSLEMQKHLLDGHRNDEIAILVRSVIAMQRAIRSAIESLQEEAVRRSQAQERISLLNRTLEIRVQERTAALVKSEAAAQSVLELTHSAFWSYHGHGDCLHLEAGAVELLGLLVRSDGQYPLPMLLDAMAQANPRLLQRLTVLRNNDLGHKNPMLEARDLGFAIDTEYGEKISFATEFRRPSDGKIIWIEVLGWPRDTLRKDWDIAGSMQDITQKKLTEQYLQKANEDLAFALRQVEASQDQLVRSGKLAAVGQLMASVAHEINTPISAIQSSGESINATLGAALVGLPALVRVLDDAGMDLLLRLITPSIEDIQLLLPKEEREQRRVLERELAQANVDNARHRANILVQLQAKGTLEDNLPLLRHPRCDDILALAYQLRSIHLGTHSINEAVRKVGKIVYALRSVARAPVQASNLREFSLQESIEAVLTLYGKSFRGGITLVRDYDSDLPPLTGNPDAMSQVWTNLIQNAMQSMDKKGTLTIRLHHIPIGLRAVISDTGCGIPTAIQENIFDNFFTTKPLGEGTGLGLGIVRNIVEAHHGAIEFHSTVGEGSTFIVDLPITPRHTPTTGARLPDAVDIPTHPFE